MFTRKYLVSLLILCICTVGLLTASHAAQPQPDEAILIVAFGTSVKKAQVSYANIEKAVKTAYPETRVYWAWTAESLRKASGIASPQQALATMAAEGVRHVKILSMHIIPGQEYEDLVQIAKAAEGLPKGLQTVAISAPLLSTTENMKTLARAIISSAPEARTVNDALLFVGHGNQKHTGGVYYTALYYFLQQQDTKAFVGTIEGTPTLENSIGALAASGAKKVWLIPLMSVAGDHAINDMFATENSWQQALSAAGFEVAPVQAGLGENPAIVQLWLEHLHALWAE